MRCLSVLLVLSSVLTQVYAASDFNNLFIEPRLQYSGANRLKASLPTTEQALSVGSYLDWDATLAHFRFDGEYRYDMIYDRKYSEAAKNKYQSKFWLNELYLEKNYDLADFFLGYQKVFWGQADELRIVDVINPLDYRQFILVDLNDFALSQPMLRFTSDYLPDWHIEGMWLFRFQPNRYPPEGSEFYLDEFPDTTRKKPKRSEFGLHAGTNVKDTDLHLYWFQGYSDDPLYQVEQNELMATYPKENMTGLSASTAIAEWVIRTEAAYFHDKYYGTRQWDKEKHSTLKGLIGIDYLYKDWMLTVQVSDYHIRSWHNELWANKSETMYTLSLERKMFSDKLSLRFSDTWLDSGGGGNLFQAKVEYLYDENLSLNFHLDLLDGSSGNFLGSKSHLDRFYYSITYRF